MLRGRERWCLTPPCVAVRKGSGRGYLLEYDSELTHSLVNLKHVV